MWGSNGGRFRFDWSRRYRGAEGKVEAEGDVGDVGDAEAGADAGAERMADGNDNDDDNAENAE